MAEAVALKYRAFISYSHADTPAAKRLHKALEGFRIDNDLSGRETAQGPIPRTLRPIFRDRDDFTAGHTLGAQTLAALDASAALIVICSPASAESKYVNEEIRLFKSRHPERPVIPLITKGRPGGGEHECFAPALRFKFGQQGEITETPEPDILAADLREEADGFALATAKVVARMLGLSTDDIFRRAERERRRKERVRNAIAAAFALLCIAGGLALWDSQRKGETIVIQQQEKSQALAIAQQLLGASPAAAAGPGQEQSLVAALTAIQENAAKGDGDYAKAFELLKAGKGKEAVPLLLAAAEEKKKRAVDENKDAAKAYREAAAIAAVAEPWRARELYAEAARLDPDDINGMFQNGWFQAAAGQLAAAETAYRRVIATGQSGPDHWVLIWARVGLGNIQVQRGDLGVAKSTYQEARVIADRQAKAKPSDTTWQRDLSVSYEKIGDVLVAQGNLPEALQSYHESLAIRDRLATADPGYAEWQHDLGVAHERLGNVQMAQGDLAGALKSYETKRDIISRLSAAYPGNAEWQRDLSVAHNFLGNVQLAQGDLGAAQTSYRAYNQIISRLAKADPGNAGWQRDLSVSYGKLGTVFLDQGKLPEALQSFRDGLAIADRLATADPGNTGWQRDLSVSYDNVAGVLFAQGNLPEALKSYRHSLAIRNRLAAADPGNAEWKGDLAASHGLIGQLLVALGEKEEALRLFREGRAIVAPLAANSGHQLWIGYLQKFDAQISNLDAHATTPSSEPGPSTPP